MAISVVAEGCLATDDIVEAMMRVEVALAVAACDG
jgi:hypothetical protein